jgi:hypothetical protein
MTPSRTAPGQTTSRLSNALWAPTTQWRALLIGSALVFLLALAMRLVVAFGQPVFLDELFAHLAAGSLRTEGSLRIYEGFYTRASVFTHLVSLFSRPHDLDIIAERFPAAAFGAAMITVLFAWTSRRATLAAAILAALMLGLSDVSLKLSAYVRFYTLHALLLLLAAILVYEATQPGRKLIFRAAATILALAALALATHLQATSLIFLVGLGGWLILDLVYRQRRWLIAHWREIAVGLALLSLGAVVAVIALWDRLLADKVRPVIAEFFGTAAWNRDHASSYGYYLKALLESEPGLLYALPLATLAGARRAPRLVCMALIVFVSAAVLLSVGGMKNERYLFFAMPFFYLVVAVGLTEILREIAGAAPAKGSRSLAFGGSAGGWRATGWAALVTLCAICVLNPSFSRGGGLLKDGLKAMTRLGHGAAVVDDGAWTQRRADLQKAVAGGRLVLTADPFRAINYLGGYDAAVVSYISPKYPEFVGDPRSGRPSISTGQSLALIQSCFPRGVLLLTNATWPDPSRISPSLKRQLERTTSLVVLEGQENNVFAFFWDRASAEETPVVCAALAHRLRHHTPTDPSFLNGPLAIP